MVLQREMPVPVWGTAPAGARVTVMFAGQVKTTSVDRKGEWRVILAPLAASAHGRVLSVTARDPDDELPVGRLSFTNIVVGEVWLAAGQSNMEFPLRESIHAKEALAKASHSDIRVLKRLGAARGDSSVYTAATIRQLAVDKFCSGRWRIASPGTIGDFSAVAWYFGVRLANELKVPVGLIDVSIGGTPAEAWIRRAALASDPDLQVMTHGNWLTNVALGDWCRDRAKLNLKRALTDGEAIPGDDLGPNHSFKPGFMWDAAVQPLVRFAVRGVIWYQGESNAGTPERVRQYAQLFPLLIRDWRSQWGRADLPFYFVQLPAMDRLEWPAFREVQRRVLESVPDTGMAVTIDTGNRNNVHPPLKKPVGERLALWALAGQYGRRLECSGPLVRNIKRSGDRLIIEFTHGEGLRTKDNSPPVGFEIAGTEGRFVKATAAIDGDSVVLHSPAVQSPVEARYGWQPFPEPALNLINSAGFPASPFGMITSAPDK